MSIIGYIKGENFMTDNTIAKTIYEQITHKTMFMIGAKNFVYDTNMLSFRVRGSKRVNYIRITLNSMDTYDMVFGKIWGLKHTIIEEHKGVHNDMLRELIREETRLEVSLGTMGAI